MTDNWWEEAPLAKSVDSGTAATPTHNWYEAAPLASEPKSAVASEVKPYQPAPDKTPTWSDMPFSTP